MSKLPVARTITKAHKLLKRGEIIKAKELYELVLKDFPNNKRAQCGLSHIATLIETAPQVSLPQVMLDEIHTLYSRRQFRLVIDKIKVLSKTYPEEVIPWTLLGAAYAQIGNLESAIKSFEQVTLIEPTSPDGYYNLGTALKDNGNLNAAIAAFNAVLNLKPNHAFALNNLGTVYKQLQMFDEAEGFYRKALVVDPNYASAHNNLGVALLEKGNLEEAKLAYQNAIKVNSNFAEAYFNLADVCSKLGSLQEAVIASEKALLIEPNYPEVLINLGNILSAQGKVNEAKEALNRAISIAPNSAIAHYNLGNTMTEEENISQAISSYKSAISINPNYAEAYHNLGRALQLQNNFNEALMAYENALRIRPDYAEAYDGAGNCLIELDQPEEATSYFQHAQKLKPSFINAFLNEATVLQLRGKKQEAIIKLRQAVTFNPESSAVFKSLGNILMELDNTDEALIAYTSAITLNPQDAELQNSYGNALKDSGRFEEAMEAFKKVLELDPDDNIVQKNLGLLYWLNCNFKIAFELMEWRWNDDDLMFGTKFDSKHPTWTGEQGADVFVWKEQGIGDEIMFSSTLSEMNEKSGKLIVECDKRLIPLYERSFSSDITFTDNRFQVNEADYDNHIALGSLLKYFRHGLEDFGRVSSGWLKADPERVDYLRGKLSTGESDKIIGISWFTNSSRKKSSKRNILLESLMGYLKQVPANFVSLQYGDTREEIEKLSKDQGIELNSLDEIDLYNDIDGLAALISACDVVISIDNLTVHLAGALGIDTKVLLPVVPDVRWGKAGSESYWYDHLTLYRQDKKSVWDVPLEHLIADITR